MPTDYVNTSGPDSVVFDRKPARKRAALFSSLTRYLFRRPTKMLFGECIEQHCADRRFLFCGSHIIDFFGNFIPLVRWAGAGTGFDWLVDVETEGRGRTRRVYIGSGYERLFKKAFYPLTLPPSPWGRESISVRSHSVLMTSPAAPTYLFHARGSDRSGLIAGSVYLATRFPIAGPGHWGHFNERDMRLFIFAGLHRNPDHLDGPVGRC